MITFRDFIIFLAENHCLRLYWSNLEFNCNVTGIRRFNQRLDFIFKLRPHSWLLYSFNWSSSKEGFDYWSRLHDLWNKYCDFLLKNG